MRYNFYIDRRNITPGNSCYQRSPAYRNTSMGELKTTDLWLIKDEQILELFKIILVATKKKHLT